LAYLSQESQQIEQQTAVIPRLR
jgi:multidrug resistance efflux pump